MCAITRNHYSAQCGQIFYQYVFEFYTHNFTRFNVFFHSLKDRRYKEYLVKLSDRISKMQQQKSFILIMQEQQLQSRAQCAFLQDLFHFLRFLSLFHVFLNCSKTYRLVQTWKLGNCLSFLHILSKPWTFEPSGLQSPKCETAKHTKT